MLDHAVIVSITAGKTEKTERNATGKSGCRVRVGEMNTKSIAGVWDRVIGVQPHPSGWLVVATCVVALAAVVPHGVWRMTRNAVTIAHEGGHGLVALISGRRLES